MGLASGNMCAVRCAAFVRVRYPLPAEQTGSHPCVLLMHACFLVIDPKVFDGHAKPGTFLQTNVLQQRVSTSKREIIRFQL